MEATADKPKEQAPTPLTDELDEILREIDRALEDGEPEPADEDGDDG